MKKFLRFLLVLIIVVVGGIVILGVVEPKDVTVTRTTIIKAPKETVFEQIVYFKNWTNWSPWYRMDSGKMKVTLYGTDGQASSGYTWKGSEKTGAGDMRDSAVKGTDMTYVLTFTEPQHGTAWGNLKAEDSAGMTKTTWTCNMHFPFPLNATLLFMNMDKMLGGDFESGLSNMKTYIESHAVASPVAGEIEVKEVDFPAHMYAGMRSTVGWNDMMKFFGDSYSLLGKGLGMKINGPSAGLFYTWDTVNKNTDMMACFPVADSTLKIKGASYVYVAASKAVMAVQKGGYSGSMAVHGAIKKYLDALGRKQTLVIEEYVVTMPQEPDSNKWVTNVYYLVQ